MLLTRFVPLGALFTAAAIAQQDSIVIPAFVNGASEGQVSGFSKVMVPSSLSELGPGKDLVTGRPFSAIETFENTMIVYSQDGKQMPTASPPQRLYRDSKGRTRRERPLIEGPGAPPLPTVVEIADLASSLYYVYVVEPYRKVAYRIRYAPGASPRATPPQLPAPGPLPFEGFQGRIEALPSREIEGLQTEGRRRVVSSPIKSSEDTWYSPQLWMTVLYVDTEPNRTLTRKLTNISIADPNPELFAPPAGFRIVDSPSRFDLPFGPVPALVSMEQVGTLPAGTSAPRPPTMQLPEYTQAAYDAKVTGAVLVSSTIGVDGVARNVRVVKSLDKGLDQEVVDVVSKTAFIPARRGGMAVAAEITFEVTFRIP